MVIDDISVSKNIIKGKSCYIINNGSSGPVILWGFYPHRGDADSEIEHMVKCLKGAGIDGEYTIIAYQVDDWNRDFSPWTADIGNEQMTFAGGGKDTLAWIEQFAIPYVRSNWGDVKIFTMGYSLAGLFALWCLYESDVFDGGICCSGSLWFPGWDEYVKIKSLKTDNLIIYLSLGGKEANTDNEIMATAAERFKEQERILKRDSRVNKVYLEWNSGGHFADSAKRMVKGIKWILNS